MVRLSPGMSYIISVSSHFTSFEYLFVRSFPKPVKYYSVNQNFFRAEKTKRQNFRGKEKNRILEACANKLLHCWRNVPLSKYSRFSRSRSLFLNLFNFHFQLVSTFLSLEDQSIKKSPCEKRQKTRRIVTLLMFQRSDKNLTKFADFKANFKQF